MKDERTAAFGCGHASKRRPTRNHMAPSFVRAALVHAAAPYVTHVCGPLFAHVCGSHMCVAPANFALTQTSQVDDVIDYGMNARVVRGAITGLVLFAPINENQCEVTMYQCLDAGGRVPAWVVNAKLPVALGAAEDMRSEFQRDDEIDAKERSDFSELVKNEPQTYSAAENVMIERVLLKLDDLQPESFRVLDSPDHRVKMGLSHATDGDIGGGIMLARVTVDSTIEESLAWEIVLSRETMKEKSGVVKRHRTKHNSHCCLYCVYYDIGLPGFHQREFVNLQLWARRGDKLIGIYCHTESVEFPVNSTYVRGLATELSVYEKLKPVGGIPQTRVTLTTQVDLGGIIPHFAVDASAADFLGSAVALRKLFDKSVEIDKASRTIFVDMIASHDAPYSDAEKKLIDEGRQYFATFEGGVAKSLKMTSPLTSAKKTTKKGDSKAWGWATTSVRASEREVLAFVWDLKKRASLYAGDLEKNVDEEVNHHNQLHYTKKKSPYEFIRNRDFLNRVVWKEEEDGGGYLLVLAPELSERGPHTEVISRGLSRDQLSFVFSSGKAREKPAIRAEFSSAMRIKRKNDNETTVEYVMHPNMGGQIPGFVMNAQLASNLSYITDIQEYFQAQRGLDAWDGEDGKAVGEILFQWTAEESHHGKGVTRKQARVADLRKKYKGLQDVTLKYVWFEAMLVRVLDNKLRLTPYVNTRLCR